MKKILLVLFILFLACWVWAEEDTNPYIAGLPVASESPTHDTCGDGILFSWYCNSTTVGDTGYTPYGCSSGDTSATPSVDATIHDGYIDAADSNKFFKFDVSSYDIMADTAGSVLLDIQVDTFVNYGGLFRLYGDGANYLQLYLTSDNDAKLTYEGNDTLKAITLTGNHISTSTRYYIIVRWTQADVNPNLYLELFNASKVSLESVSDDTNLADFTTAPGTDDLRIGEFFGVDAAIRIYSIKVWDTYAGAGF